MILGFLVFTGPFLLFILSNNLGQVLTSSYGYTLIVKLSLAVVMLAFGSYNQLSIQKEAQKYTSISISISTNGKSGERNNPSDPNFADSYHKKGTKKNNGGIFFLDFHAQLKLNL